MCEFEGCCTVTEKTINFGDVSTLCSELYQRLIGQLCIVNNKQM